MTSVFASATVTLAGGGLLLAKYCLIPWLRRQLNPTKPPTTTANTVPTMTNQRSIRMGRRGFSVNGLPEILASFTMFILSCTFCAYLWLRRSRQFAIQVKGDCGFV